MWGAFTLCLIGISVGRSFNEITSRIMGLSLLVNIFRHFWGFMEYGGLHICQIYISVKSRASQDRSDNLSPSVLTQNLCQLFCRIPRLGRCRVPVWAQEGKCLKDYLHTSDIINGSVHATVQGRDQAGAPRWVSLSSVARAPGSRTLRGKHLWNNYSLLMTSSPWVSVSCLLVQGCHV